VNTNDILDREIARLEEIIAKGRLSFLPRISQSKPALLTIAAFVLLFQMRHLPEQLANSSLDAAIAVQAPTVSRSVRLVTIDDADYAALFHARSPLDPQLLSQLLNAVAAAAPRAIVVDLDTEDESFRDMPTPAVPTVWNVSGEELAGGKLSVAKPLGGRPLANNSVRALAMAPRDERGVVRGYPHSYQTTDGAVDSPGYAAARIVSAGEPPESGRHLHEMHFLDYRYRFATIKARDLLADAASPAWNTLGFFRGQVVVIGGTYRVARDVYATPRGLLNGCEIIAQAAAAEIEGTFISPVNRVLTGLLMIAGGLATLAVYHWLAFRTAFVVSLLLIPVLSIAANWILFHRFAAWGVMVPLVVAVIVAELYSKAALYLAFYQRVSSLKADAAAAPADPG
jgi:CHASE2 domain-containing sensor protein